MLKMIALTLSALPSVVSPALAQEAAPVPVTVTAKGCEPNALTVKAGRVTFMITNRSSRALEWEILKGVMIVDERENIAPGFKQRLSTTLEPGEYAVTCGLLSNPRGKLVVLNAQGGTDAAAVKPSMSELVGLSAEYRVWTASQLAVLAKPAERRAVRDIVLRLTPLKALAKSQAEALETALASGSADLAAPAGAYAESLRKVSVAPQALLDGLAAMATALVTADPSDAPALLAGIEEPATHVLALVKRADPALADELTARLATIRAALHGEGTVKDAAAALAGSLAKVPTALGTS